MLKSKHILSLCYCYRFISHFISQSFFKINFIGLDTYVWRQKNNDKWINLTKKIELFYRYASVQYNLNFKFYNDDSNLRKIILIRLFIIYFGFCESSLISILKQKSIHPKKELKKLVCDIFQTKRSLSKN